MDEKHQKGAKMASGRIAGQSLRVFVSVVLQVLANSVAAQELWSAENLSGTPTEEGQALEQLAQAIDQGMDADPDLSAVSKLQILSTSPNFGSSYQSDLLAEQAMVLEGQDGEAEAILRRRHEIYLVQGGARDEIWARLVEEHVRWLLAHDRAAEAVNLQREAVAEYESLLGKKATALAPHLELLRQALKASAAENYLVTAVNSRLKGLEPQMDLSAPIVAMGPASNPVVGVGKQKLQKVRVFYATNRAKTVPGDWFSDRWYGSIPAPMQYGVTEVWAPQRNVDELEPNALWGYEVAPARLKNTTLAQLVPVDLARFRTLVRNDAATLGREILIFVHGYNVTFSEAVEVTANLAVDLDIRGAAIAYSWPSAGSALRYGRDGNIIEAASIAIPHQFSLLVGTIAKDNPGARIFVMAHSMGNRVAMPGLAKLALDQPNIRLANVILASPDIEAKDYIADAPAIARVADRLTLYASQKDWALRLSTLVNRGPRAGFPGTLPPTAAGDKVDTTLPGPVSGVTPSFLGHSDFMGDALVDIRSLVWFGASTAKRCILRQGTTYFTFLNTACALGDYSNALVAVRKLGKTNARAHMQSRAKIAVSDDQRKGWMRVDALIESQF